MDLSYSTQAMAGLGTSLTIKSWHWLKIIFFHQKGKEQCVLGAQFGIQRSPKDGCGLISSPIAEESWIYSATLSILGQGLQCACALLFWGSSPWSTQLFAPFAHPAPFSSSAARALFLLLTPNQGGKPGTGFACKLLSSARTEQF